MQFKERLDSCALSCVYVLRYGRLTQCNTATENKNYFPNRPLRAHAERAKTFLIQNFFFAPPSFSELLVSSVWPFSATQVSLHLNLKLRRSLFFRFSVRESSSPGPLLRQARATSVRCNLLKDGADGAVWALSLPMKVSSTSFLVLLPFQQLVPMTKVTNVILAGSLDPVNRHVNWIITNFVLAWFIQAKFILSQNFWPISSETVRLVGLVTCCQRVSTFDTLDQVDKLDISRFDPILVCEVFCDKFTSERLSVEQQMKRTSVDVRTFSAELDLQTVINTAIWCN